MEFTYSKLQERFDSGLCVSSGKDLSHDGSNHINCGTLASNGTCFVYVYENIPQIDIYDPDFNLVKSITKKYTPLAYRYGTKDEKSYYGSVFAGTNYFYCLYSGLSTAENEENVCYLEVYNYEGEPIIKYTIREHIPVGFVVDEERSCLYGFSPVESGILYIYELEGLE